MSVQVLDSPRRCARCGKRMVLDIGPDGYYGEWEMQAVHRCWSCDYSEVDHEWTRPLRSDVLPILARIRDQIRAGVEVPMVYDRTPSTVEQAIADSDEALRSTDAA